MSKHAVNTETDSKDELIADLIRLDTGDEIHMEVDDNGTAKIARGEVTAVDPVDGNATIKSATFGKREIVIADEWKVLLMKSGTSINDPVVARADGDGWDTRKDATVTYLAPVGEPGGSV